eukprot:PhF_6_TR32619/c0_g1_i1/m.48233
MAISIQKLRQKAMEASAALEAADNSSFQSTSSELPPFEELQGINQAEIDRVETEIHNSVAAASITPSTLLQIWERLLEIHRHMVAEATKVISEHQKSGAQTLTTAEPH